MNEMQSFVNLLISSTDLVKNLHKKLNYEHMINETIMTIIFDTVQFKYILCATHV